MGCAGSAVSSHRRLVGHHVIAVDPGVVDVVAGEHALRARRHRGAGEGAGVKGQRCLGSHDLAVVGGPHLYPHIGAGGGAGGLENLGSAHGALDRHAGLLRQQGSQRLQIYGNLPAEASADFHGNDPDLGHGQVQHSGQGVAGGEGALGAGPDGQLAIGVPEGCAVLGFNVPLVHRGSGILLLHDDVSGGEALLQVALFVAEMGGDVAVLVSFLPHLRGGLVLMEQLGVFSHRLTDLGGRLQRFVLHLDEG